TPARGFWGEVGVASGEGGFLSCANRFFSTISGAAEQAEANRSTSTPVIGGSMEPFPLLI
ncbi:MAG: hypothetical protein ACLGPL_11290, partial [Acidobacteriota bacterium]